MNLLKETYFSYINEKLVLTKLPNSHNPSYIFQQVNMKLLLPKRNLKRFRKYWKPKETSRTKESRDAKQLGEEFWSVPAAILSIADLGTGQAVLKTGDINAIKC